MVDCVQQDNNGSPGFLSFCPWKCLTYCFLYYNVVKNPKLFLVWVYWQHSNILLKRFHMRFHKGFNSVLQLGDYLNEIKMKLNNNETRLSVSIPIKYRQMKCSFWCSHWKLRLSIICPSQNLDICMARYHYPTL